MQKRISDLPLVYIVILNYKNWHDVVKCLESVFHSTYRNFSVFVIDNHSENGSLEHLMEWAGTFPLLFPVARTYIQGRDLNKLGDPALLPQLVFVQNEENNGFAGGNNIILKILADQDAYVWLLNPDMVVQDDTLFELVGFAGAEPFGAVIGSVIKYHDRPEHIHMYGGGRVRFNSGTASLITEKEKVRELDYISGGSLFTHATQFRNIGLLPEDYFLYWEETDWCYQARLQGYPLIVCMTSVCYDKVGTSIGRGFLAEYYYTRNGLLFLSKYKKEKIRVALFLSFLRLLKKMVLGQLERAKGVYGGMRAFIKLNSYAHK